MKLKQGFVLREVAGDIVVVPSDDILDLNLMISLNDTAAFLWKILEVGATEEELVNALLDEYEITKEDAQKHVNVFGAKLNEYGFLE